MSERLVERCALELERYVQKLHSGLLGNAVARASIPIAPYEMAYTKDTISNPIDIARRGIRSARQVCRRGAGLGANAADRGGVLPLAEGYRGHACLGLLCLLAATHEPRLSEAP